MAAKKKAAKKAAKKPPTAKQLAARKAFAERARARSKLSTKKPAKKAGKKRLSVSSKKIGTAASGPEKAMASFAMKETLRANAAERELAALKEKAAKPKRKMLKKTAKKAAKKHHKKAAKKHTTHHAAPKAAAPRKTRKARKTSAPGVGTSLRATAFTVGTGRRTKVYKTWTCFGEKRTGCGGGSDGGHVLGDRRKYKAVRYR